MVFGNAVLLVIMIGVFVAATRIAAARATARTVAVRIAAFSGSGACDREL